jgi:hypothetical protein
MRCRGRLGNSTFLFSSTKEAVAIRPNDAGRGLVPALTWAINLLLKCAMTILRGTGRYIFFLSVFILILQVAVVTGQNRKGGVTVSYESSGSSRVARFKNSNSFHVRVEFSYNGTRVRGSAEASGEDAVFVPANYSATYGGHGISITSVRITGVMRSD